jgi:hypothetical protein
MTDPHLVYWTPGANVEPAFDDDAMNSLSWLKTLVVSVIGGALTALVFACFLDPEVSFRAVTLPAVFPLATGTGLMVGLLAWPLVHFALRRTNLKLSIPILYFVVITGTILFMRFVRADPLLGPPLALILGLLVCWILFRRTDQVENAGANS